MTAVISMLRGVNVGGHNKIKMEALRALYESLKLRADVLIGEKKWDFFIVASYGKIIPQSIIDMPKNGTLNVPDSI